MLDVAGRYRDKVADAQWWCSPTETVDGSWVITREIGEPGDTWRWEMIWATRDPDPDSLGLVRELGCVKSQVLVKNGWCKQGKFAKKFSATV